MAGYPTYIRIRLWAGVIFGILVGVGLGILMENLWLGFAIGVILGIVFGSRWAKTGLKRDDKINSGN
ncbi:MAG: hypothetical protein JSW07_20295 [bacterium]|nr:MAG: hypothetical protein JSW07_20295 [bacterium]